MINWFPGHMTKARREIEASIKLIDIAVMVVDARAPFSCRNLELEKLVRPKKLIMVLNKMDLAEPQRVKLYKARFKEEGIRAAAIDSHSGKGNQEVQALLADAYREQAENMVRRGRRVRAARAMVIGVPNVGKSTFLNCMVGRKITATGAKPGVTRGKQWVRIRDDLELMDTPGLMWPKIEHEEQGFKLALLDIVGEKAYREYDVALFLIDFLRKQAKAKLTQKYKITVSDEALIEEILNDIARARGHLLKGGAMDLEKTCRMLLHDFRKGALGRICLD